MTKAEEYRQKAEEEIEESKKGGQNAFHHRDLALVYATLACSCAPVSYGGQP